MAKEIYTEHKQHNTPHATKILFYSYFADNIDPTDSSNFIGVIDKADVSLGGGVQLPDVNVSEAFEELVPDVCSHTVTNGELHFVVSVIFLLQRGHVMSRD